jgi:hypothetical protein
MNQLTDDQKAECVFYQAVADLLGCVHDYNPWIYDRRTRWNHRRLGNGRYLDHGMVRRYSSTLIHVSLRVPQLNGCYTSESDALQAIEQAVIRQAQSV